MRNQISRMYVQSVGKRRAAIGSSPQFTRSVVLGLVCLAWLGCCGTTVVGQAANKNALSGAFAVAEADAPADVAKLVAAAAKAQGDGDYETAARLWQELLRQEKPAAAANVQSDAHLNLGFCYAQLRNFERAITHFEQGLETIAAESVAQLPQALLHLGYSQLEQGRLLQRETVAAAGDDQATETAKLGERANQLLTTSTQTLSRLLRRYPTFEMADQAAFFQAEGFAALGRLADATTAYKKLQTFEQPQFAAEGRFALANVHEKLGRYDEALQNYVTLIDQRESLAPSQRPLVVESRFRAAEVLLKLGETARQQGLNQQAMNDFAKAFDLYQAVADDPDAGEMVPLALYGAAWSKVSMAVGDSPDAKAAAHRADELFGRLLENFPSHRLVGDATTGRGSARRLAGELAAAVGDLSKIENDGSAGADSSDETRLELGLVHVEQGDWPQAIDVFRGLVTDFPDSAMTGRYHYELAWALRSASPSQQSQSLEQFRLIAQEMPNSQFASEAHFHLATAAFMAGQDKVAAEHYQVVVDSDLPTAVRERSLYQLAWANYRQDDFAVASKWFDRQLDEFPSGELTADAKFMFAESQFRQDKHADALQAYLVAKPAIDADGNVDSKMQVLISLHGAESANAVQNYEEAIKLAKAVTELDVDPSYQADAWLQLGIAAAGLDDSSSAVEAWRNASASLSVTGAHSRCLLGESFAKAGQVQDAINEFKLVFFGYGGIDAPADVRPWQAYALYEAARLNQQLCRDSVGPVLRRHVAEAKEQYQRLLDHYADSDVADEAKRQLAKLQQY